MIASDKIQRRKKIEDRRKGVLETDASGLKNHHVIIHHLRFLYLMKEKRGKKNNGN